MAKVDMFLELLINYDKENIHPDVIKAIQPYLKDPEFEPGKWYVDIPMMLSRIETHVEGQNTR